MFQGSLKKLSIIGTVCFFFKCVHTTVNVATSEVLRICMQGTHEVLSKVMVMAVKLAALREQLTRGFIDPCL